MAAVDGFVRQSKWVLRRVALRILPLTRRQFCLVDNSYVHTTYIITSTCVCLSMKNSHVQNSLSAPMVRRMLSA